MRSRSRSGRAGWVGRRSGLEFGEPCGGGRGRVGGVPFAVKGFEKEVGGSRGLCGDFDERGYAFDFALAALDLALLYREEKRWAEIRVLANRMVGIFRERRVHRETIAAVLLFKEAAENEALSVELVRRLQSYLKQAQAQPGLRFE